MITYTAKQLFRLYCAKWSTLLSNLSNGISPGHHAHVNSIRSMSIFEGMRRAWPTLLYRRYI